MSGRNFKIRPKNINHKGKDFVVIYKINFKVSFIKNKNKMFYYVKKKKWHVSEQPPWSLLRLITSEVIIGTVWD